MARISFSRLSIAATSVAAVLLSGCWTFSESTYPKVAVVGAQGVATNLTVAVTGFDFTFTAYEAVHGYTTAYVPGYIGHHHYHPGHYETVSTHTLVPQVRTSDMFRSRAKDELEDAGFVITTTATPDCTIEVKFGGPLVDSNDTYAGIAWKVLTVFFCDYAAESWTAKMKIRDNHTGKVIFNHSYEQRYETKVFGLIPIFGIASCDETSSSAMRNWCLAALTDRAVADATAFLSK